MSTYRKELGTHKLPNEARGCWRHGIDTRSCKVKVWAEIQHPKLNDFLDDAVKCAAGCATGALIVALATGVGAAAAWAGFKACFYGCLALKIPATTAKKVKLKFGTKKEVGKWSGH